MIGKLLNERYRIDTELGRGGMGVVYQGYDTKLERDIAVKVLSESGLGTQGHARLMREAQSAARLNHPNIVTIYDVGEFKKMPFIIMELIDGNSLHEQLPESIEDTIAITRQLCNALEHAHNLGIIHRDLKPENILLTPDRQLKLMDFGLARIDASNLTQEGTLVGTIYYISPEQAQGKEVDGRTDLYALGVMLYQFATGILPFESDSVIEIIAQHLHAEVKHPNLVNKDIPEPLNDLIVQLLNKDPKDRPQSASEVLYFIDHEGLWESTRSYVPPKADEQSAQTGKQQTIRFTNSSDGARIAYSTIGEGPPFVMSAVHLSHLEYDWEVPLWRHWLEEFSENNTLVRYNYRGTGLSDWNVNDLAWDGWVRDLEAVVDTLGIEKFPLLAASQSGTVSIKYAHDHPDKVSHLILYGSYARGWLNRDLTDEQKEEEAALMSLIKVGWGHENSNFRQFFAREIIPEANQDQMEWYDTLMRKATSTENMLILEKEMHLTNVEDLLPKIQVPTLVIHPRYDQGVPYEEGMRMASKIPNATFVTLDSKNHLLLEHEPAWKHFTETVHKFIKDN
ncbi:MAG: alpha/beta fold hydrolase [Chloroflexi bacterium]|nr:alpha/beta fold hydrolase [Chloroflexota bacterium]